MWCTYWGMFPNDEKGKPKVYRRCRQPPHHLKHKGCDRCKDHCGKQNEPEENIDFHTGYKEKDPRNSRKNWKFDPITGKQIDA